VIIRDRAISSITLTALVGVAMFAASVLSSTPARAQGCDPSYPEICLPAYPHVDCFNIGYPIIVIYNPSLGAYDPHYLDPDYDGIGCELG
jgi:micrococcal nuclease